MHVHCPHCRNAIEIIEDVELSDINCPSCGSSFNLLGDDETLTRHSSEVQTLGKFKLVDQVGIGAFGTVWKANDVQLDRQVAVKIPRKGQLDAEEAEQFLREARAAAQLNHPNIVSVHEVGRQDDTIYIVSDFIDGVTLADWLTANQYSFPEISELCARLASALHHAHENGVIHRDLKPGNIMLSADGMPHIMDFGLAKREAGEVTMTVDGRILGTPAYMSPEQARGEAHHVDRCSDVYSLGVILFELLTGERPFRGNTRMLLHQVLNDEPPSPRKLNSNVPKDLETICLKCLEKEPRKRYATAQEVADELRRYSKGDSIVARPISAAERTWKWAKRHRILSVSSLVLFVILQITTGMTIFGAATVRRALKAADEAESMVIEAEFKVDEAKSKAEASEKKLLDSQEQMEKAEKQAAIARKDAKVAQEKAATEVLKANEAQKIAEVEMRRADWAQEEAAMEMRNVKVARAAVTMEQEKLAKIRADLDEQARKLKDKKD